MFIIGKEYFLGWETSENMGSRLGSYGDARCEAFGVDWAVFRATNGEPLVATFDDMETFIQKTED